ncbi:MAG: hypothetical protein HW421_42 [Ignavibacteria bacterium]|nr:hypothetical protein [Ignavibacteria bacterium]
MDNQQIIKKQKPKEEPKDEQKNEQKNEKQIQKNYKDRKFRKFDNDRTKQTFVSVVIPVFNEEESLQELTQTLEGELDKFAKNSYEIIFIDDGSTDKSFDIMKQLNKRNQNIKVLRFRRNYGKSAALTVGFAEARGLVVITMDADLQDDPKEIQNLISKLKEGYDLVSGWKKKRKDPITKTIPSRFFNFVTSIVTGLKLHDFNCGLKAYRREVVKNLQIYGEIYRYIPALAKWEGFKVTEIPVEHHSRKFGKSKFGSTRLIKGFLDLLTILFTTRYIKRPLHFFGTFGTLFFLTGFALNVYLTVEWFLGKTWLSNRPLALFGVALIIVGVQLFSIGLIGEMLVKNSISNITYSIKEKISSRK